MGDIEKLKFKIPDIKEQTAIANVLSDMDIDIEELERKRDKYKMIKEGMMQQLLTGRIRLKC
jgi:type I restriction enzyme S subunit